MDLTLFRALQSIKTIEDDDLEFQTQTIDYETFQAKYPHIIVVDQRKKSPDERSITTAAGISIGRRIVIFLSGIGYRILPRHTDRISDIGYRISESDISMNRLRILTNG